VSASTESPSIQRLNSQITLSVAVGTALLGAALGVAPDLMGSTFDAPDFGPRLATGLVFFFAGSVALWTAYRRWRRRTFLLHDRGTLYVVDSPLETWTSEDKDAYLRAAEPEFADFSTVPGPTGLSSWRWPLGDARAQRWSDAVDDLVISFRSVWLNDDRSTPNSVVCWAAFPVAVAWTARALAAERVLPLAIRQRPSVGRVGPGDLPKWSQGTHSFDAPGHAQRRGVTCPVREAVVTLIDREPASGVWPARVRILLIRTTGETWERLEADDATGPVTLRIANRSGHSWGGGGPAELHEWRRLALPSRFHPWASYPHLADEIVGWIAQTADPDALNLVGMLVPQEVGLGIGIHIARRDQNRWPGALWPIVKPSQHHELVVPGLDLGWASLHRQYLDGPR
jgi:hypothetical protein